MPTNGQLLAVDLASWIIQDGNYGDFSVGDRAAFALEFFEIDEGDVAESKRVESPSLTNVGPAIYDVRGRVLHVGEGWWVVDAGIRFFQDRSAPKGVRVGMPFASRCMIGIDPFFYFESRAHEPDAPAMLYDWRVERIQLNTTPWVEVSPKGFKRDPEKTAWRDVGRTNAWVDDDQHGEYILHCALLDSAPRSRR